MLLLIALLLIIPGSALTQSAQNVTPFWFGRLDNPLDRNSTSIDSNTMSWDGTSQRRGLYALDIHDIRLNQPVNGILLAGSQTIPFSINYGYGSLPGLTIVNMSVGDYVSNVTSFDPIPYFGLGVVTIEYGKDNDNGDVGVLMYTGVIGISQICFYPDNDIKNNPIYSVIATNQNPSGYYGLDSYDISKLENHMNEILNPNLGAVPSFTTFLDIFNKILPYLVNVCNTITAFSVIFITNAPWLVIAIEMVASLEAFFYSDGNVFNALKRWWRTQTKIVDFFAYIPTFIERHYQIVAVAAAVVIISNLVTWITTAGGIMQIHLIP